MNIDKSSWHYRIYQKKYNDESDNLAHYVFTVFRLISIKIFALIILTLCVIVPITDVITSWSNGGSSIFFPGHVTFLMLGYAELALFIIIMLTNFFSGDFGTVNSIYQSLTPKFIRTRITRILNSNMFRVTFNGD